MKYLVFFVVAVIALVSAEEEKKPEEDQPRPEEKSGLAWPMPDPLSTGDLMLHGHLAYDRVRALFKHELKDDSDKMIMSHGRLFLRKVNEFFEKNSDFKVMPVLCRDARNLNATNRRWKIKIYDPVPERIAEEKLDKIENDSLSNGSDIITTEKPVSGSTYKPSSSGSTDKPIEVSTYRSSERPSSTADLPASSSARPIVSSSAEPLSSSVRPSSSAEPLSSSIRPSSSVEPERSSEAVSSSSHVWSTIRPSTPKIPTFVLVQVFSGQDEEKKDLYEVHKRDYYRVAGSNFARLLMKEYRNETLVKEESEYLGRWIADEAVHYGALAIYCNEGENVKEIKKQLNVYLVEDKTQ